MHLLAQLLASASTFEREVWTDEPDSPIERSADKSPRLEVVAKTGETRSLVK